MSSPKERHYWTQLRSSLTAGQWTSPTPAKAPNGVPLSWAELFRKFNKHCKGYEDVVEVARRIWGLGGLLEGKGDGDGDGGEMYPVELGGECLLGEGEGGDGREGYEALKRLEGGNFDTLNFALAYYAYALGNPTECLAHLSKVPDVSHVQNHIPLPSTLRAGAGGSALLNVPGTGTGTETSSASSFSFTAGSDVSSTMAEIKDGRAWAMVETIRSLCLQGMANEKLYPTDPQKSLDIYAASFPILTIIESELVSPTNTNPAPSSGGKIDFTSFTQFREVWRWVERLLWRAIVLGARILDIHHEHGHADGCRKNDSIWTWLGHYTSCSVYWPSSFRTAHRATISVLYLRALVLRYSPSLSPSTPSITPSPPPPWMHTARSVIQEYRAILSVSTTFPRAGERNRKVEDFVDLCVSVWEASGGVGEYTGWVLDVLWWATRLTFNSHRVLRHMTRLAYISGDTNLAKRTFKLYVQVVSKAFQTQTVGDEGEEDGRWVDTLVFGVWMICKTAGVREVREAGRLVGEARKRLRKGKGGVYGVGDARDGDGEEEKVREASVELVEGIWNVTMAIKDQNPHTRPTHLQTAHTHFLTALSLHPSSSAAHFQIAISYTRPGVERDLAKAVVHAGRAVEGEPGNVRYWHLLGLVSAKMELWDAAVGALESGVGVGVGGGEKRGGEGVEGTPGTRRSSLPVVNGQDYANVNVNGGGIDGLPSQSSPPCPPSPPPPPPPPQTILPPTPQTQQTIPPCSELLQPTTTTLTSHQASRHEQFEYALQLRMTQLAVVEYVEGVEGASGRLTEVFQWVAEVRGTTGASAARQSIDGGGPPEIKLKSPSELALTASHHSHSQSGHSNLENKAQVQDKDQNKDRERPPPLPTIDSESLQLQPPTPIPITVSPATPDTNEKEPSLSLDDKEKDKEKPTKKVQQMLKNHVHKGSARVSAISKRIANANSGHGHGGGGHGGGLRRVRSNPDFSGGGSPSYQASSIHSRKRDRGSFLMPSESESVGADPVPPPPPTSTFSSSTQTTKWSSKTTKENRLLSDLWLMSAATFRRLGKIEQAKGAIQEAEVRDEGNSGVWVQLGLYHLAMGQKHHAIDAFQKALFIDPDDVGACVHLARVYLDPTPTPENIDLVAGLLSHLTEGRGWDVPEAWYFLGKAYGMQGRERVGRERECFGRALGLSEGRGVRDLDAAVGWCL